MAAAPVGVVLCIRLEEALAGLLSGVLGKAVVDNNGVPSLFLVLLDVGGGTEGTDDSDDECSSTCRRRVEDDSVGRNDDE